MVDPMNAQTIQRIILAWQNGIYWRIFWRGANLAARSRGA